MKYTPKLKRKAGSWGKKPFEIGREGAQFQPSTFGDAPGSEKKSIKDKFNAKGGKSAD